MPGPDKIRVSFITATGLIYVLGSLAFLVAGIFRGELIATISGVSLLSFALFSCLMALLARFAWRNTAFSAEWIHTGLFRVNLCNPKKDSFISLFFSEILYCLDYATSDTLGAGRLFSVRVPLSEIVSDYTIPLPPRGIYTASNPHLQISDYTGFFIFVIRLPTVDLAAPLIVPSAPEAEPKVTFPPGKTGLTRGKSSFKRSEDLYETRNYQPGDDPRKINWKVYAHSGELSIRQGELLPPPANEYVFVLCSRMAKQPTPEEKDRYDILLARAACLASLLISKNRTVTILTSNRQNQLWSNSVYPSDTGAAEATVRNFSFPQLDPKALSAEQLLASAPEQATCLLFSMPAQLSDIRLPHSVATQMTVYIGPILEQSKSYSLSQKLRSFIFIQPKEKTLTNTNVANLTFKNTESRLKKEGFNVQKI